ncbi:MAG: leucine-rich repeat protein [Clostridia bacterium]|nr:leucine-rich repeat protein [Clostridia bacterium]
MKKLICLLLSCIFIFGINLSLTSPTDAAENAGSIEAFAEKVTQMISNYDDLPQVEIYSERPEMQEYETCRLIVKSEEKIDKLNAVSVISGYRNLWIMQFETPYDTAEAYDYYSKLDCVEYIQPDRPVTMQSTDDYTEEQKTWGSAMTRTAEAADFLKEASPAEVKVGIIDSGLDHNNDVFDGRLVDNGINLSKSGDDTAMSDDPKSHGTHIAGIIAMNTPENTKLRAYKIFDYRGNSTELLVITAIDYAVSDGMDIINLSLGTAYSEPLRESLQNAYDAGTVIVTASGNTGADCSEILPAAFEEAITVGAVNKDGIPADFSNYGSTVDIVAPGVDIYSCLNNNKYGIISGTSMATPFVSSAAALMLGYDSGLTPSQIETALKENALPVNGAYPKTKTGSGILNIAQAAEFPRADASEIIFSSKINYGDASVTFSESENVDTYYTLNGDYPTKENGILYEEPFVLTESAEIKWRSFSKDEKLFASKMNSEKIRIFSEANESDFTVNESGVLTGYKGSAASVSVPEKVNGITVTAIGNSAFEGTKASFKEIVLPDTVKSIGTKAFKQNKTVEFVKGDGLELIGESAFSDCTALKALDAANVTEICGYAFNRCTGFSDFNSFDVITVDDYAFMAVNGIHELKLDKLKNLGAWAFRNTSLEKVTLSALESFREYGGEYSCGAFFECEFLKEIYLPSMTEWGKGLSGERSFMNCKSLEIFHAPLLTLLGKYAFRNCTSLRDVNLESVETVEAQSLSGCKSLNELYLPKTVIVEEKAFTGSSIKNIRFEKLERCDAFFTESCTVILPSTASVLGFDSSYIGTTATEKVHLKIYAAPDTFAEEWANAKHNNCTSEFIALPSVITSFPEHLTNETELSVDAVGFNLTYQWYGSLDGTKENLVLLKGETENNLVIPENTEYAGFFCTVTSTENGVSSSETKGAVYADILPADYTAYNAAKAKVPSDLSIYTEETVAALNAVLSVDVSGKIAAEQSIVDSQTNAILNAISALKPKAADYSAVYEAIAAVPSDLSPYTPESVKALQEAVDGVDYNLDITKQKTVDSYANNIKEATEKLEKESFFARLFRLIAEFFKNLFS